MRGPSLALPLVLSPFIGGCFGEAAIHFHGSVVAAPAPNYSFDEAPNPSGLPPIAGAEVTMCHCTHTPCVCERDAGFHSKTDASGNYDIPDFIFPGTIGIDNYFSV